MQSRDFFDHRVQSLIGLVQRWHVGGGTDRALEARIREIVSMDLLGLAGPEVAVRALGALDVLEADRLQDMLTLCGQSFYRKDAVWNAFAVPVAVHWHMKPHRIYIAKRAQPTYLSELATAIRQCVGAENVILDSAIYSADVLYRMSARALHDHLQAMVTRGPRFTPALQRMTLRSASEPPWRMVYFLGVEITKPSGKRRLEDPGVQDAMQSYLQLGADALIKPAPVPTTTASPNELSKFEQGAFGETICHMPRYLFDAIHFGEQALRGYRLRQMLEEIAKAEKQVTLYHALNTRAFAVDLLLKGKWLAYDMQWRLRTGENVDDALRDMGEAIEATKISVQCKMVEMNEGAFGAKRDQTDLRRYRIGKL